MDGSIRSWYSGRGALIVAGSTQSAGLFSKGAIGIAIVGRPRWLGATPPAIDLDATCALLLEQYQQRGADALEALHGDFALALVDAERSDALIAIDRFGIRNLVYQADDEALIFGSDCDVVRRHPRADRQISLQAVYDYTYFHAVPGPATIFRRQQRILPGCMVSWKGGQTVARAYWEMVFAEETGSVANFKEGFRAALRDAVKSAANATDCGAFLSGGTDSSTIAGLLTSISGAPAKTYSIGFAVPGYDELDYARIAARHFGTRHHEYYVTARDVVAAVPRIAAAYDQPFGNASAVPAYYCARLAQSDGVALMLAGDGGDELFGGNSRYAKQYQLALYHRLPRPLRARLIEPLLLSGQMPPALASWGLLRKAKSYVEQASRPMPARYESYNLIDHLGAQTVFTPEFLSQVDLGSPLKLLDATYQHFSRASLINQMLGIDLKFTLADSDLPKVTRMCELAGVEVAFPMLHESVVELSGRLPAELKLRGSQLRYFFKEALRDFLPAEILSKEKHGFGLPVGAWLTTEPELRSLVGDALSGLKSRGIVAPRFIDELMGEHLRNHAAYFGTMAWVLMMLEFWFRKDASSAP
jgi:asparagine synthase (glutamine-hydrolysing)